jgi:hypothetical protein
LGEAELSGLCQCGVGHGLPSRATSDDAVFIDYGLEQREFVSAAARPLQQVQLAGVQLPARLKVAENLGPQRTASVGQPLGQTSRVGTGHGPRHSSGGLVSGEGHWTALPSVALLPDAVALAVNGAGEFASRWRPGAPRFMPAGGSGSKVVFIDGYRSGGR